MLSTRRLPSSPRLGPAIHLAKTEPFDLDAKGAERVTLVANPEELEFADGELRLLGHFCTFLERPPDVETLAFLVTHDALYVERWASPVPAARRLGDDDAATDRELRAVPRARVLVVDDEGIDRETSDAASRIGVDLVVSHNAWHALDRLDEEWDGVVCSLAMKTPTGTPVYRMLWNGRPEMKSRFAFLVSPGAAPVSGTAHVITRPLSADALAAFLDAVGRGRENR